jgi:hypothetical protein
MIKLIVLSILVPLGLGLILSISLRYTLRLLKTKPTIRVFISGFFWIFSILLIFLNLYALKALADSNMETLPPYMTASLLIFLLYIALIERHRLGELRRLNSNGSLGGQKK